MPNTQTTATSLADDQPVAPVAPVAPAAPDGLSLARPSDTATMAKIITYINEARNILIALSADPSVDELAAAIGLSICLDRAGKRATAIYSGITPNALEFLKPEDTFETTADALQDFVIALSKDKADHLRYKLDGDYVRIFITPYKTRIDAEDLEFSYGDYNVDLVLALGVANSTDLDAALREHGRIMHDASVINITTGNPGNFGTLEWSDTAMSSVSEMCADLIYSSGGKISLESEDATAFLTGIIAATEHFSNVATTASSMQVASRLMTSGANQRLVSEHIMSTLLAPAAEPIPAAESASAIESAPAAEPVPAGTPAVAATDEPTDASVTITHSTPAPKESTTLEAEPSIPAEEPVAPALPPVDSALASPAASVEPAAPVAEPSEAPVAVSAPAEAEDFVLSPEPTPASTSRPSYKSRETIASFAASSRPAGNSAAPASTANPDEEDSNRLGDLLRSAFEKKDSLGASLADAGKPAPVAEPSSEPVAESTSEPLAEPSPAAEATPAAAPAPSLPEVNPAASITPDVPAKPEINGVPEINYGPLPGESVLPPPPTPPVDINAPTIMPPSFPEDQSSVTPPTPGSFKIPTL